MKGEETCSKLQSHNLPPPLQKSIEEVVKKEGFTKYNIIARQISATGNYLGELHLVDVKGETIDGPKETNIFVKKIIPDSVENLKDQLRLNDAFSSEYYFYTELSRVFTELQENANIPEPDRYKLIKGYDESSEEAIILENIAIKGFKTGERMEVVSLRYAQLSIEQLAKFHGLSFVLEKRRPKYFERKVATVKYPFTWGEKWVTATRQLMKSTTSNMTDGVYKRKAEEFIETALVKYPDYLDEHQTPIRCLCHGDYRASNVLMKEIKGVLTEVIPVDYQHINYGCPINDLIFFIYLGTDRKFRTQHLENLKDLYFNTLKTFLKYFDLDVDEILPRNLFDEVYKRRQEYTLIVGLFFFPLIFADEDSVFEVCKDVIGDWKPKLDSRSEERIVGIIDELMESDVLN